MHRRHRRGEVVFDGHVREADAESIFVELVDRANGEESYAEIPIAKLPASERHMVDVGLNFYCAVRRDGFRFRFSRARWTEYDIEQIGRAAAEMQHLFGSVLLEPPT